MASIPTSEAIIGRTSAIDGRGRGRGRGRGPKDPAYATLNQGKPPHRHGLAPVVRASVIGAPGMAHPHLAAVLLTVLPGHARDSA